jgi:hypothetical protein
LIKEWVYNYDQDIFSFSLPEDYIVKDTPVDLGVGFPLIFGYKACSGEIKIPVEVYGGATMDFDVNNTVRRNIMSYWRCDNAVQVFSADQVRRMEWVLKNKRSNLISRVVALKTLCKKIYQKELYRELEKYTRIPIPDPGPDWKRISTILQVDELKDKETIEEIKLVTRTIPAFHPWNKTQLEVHMKNLEKTGMLKTIPSATNAAMHVCGADRKRVR